MDNDNFDNEPIGGEDNIVLLTMIALIILMYLSKTKKL